METSARQRLPIVLIIATVTLDAMGIGLILPILPELIQGLDGRGLDDAAVIGGWLGFTYAAMQFLLGPSLGVASDALGRRPVLVATLLAMALHYALMAVAGSLALLFAARLLGGASAANMATATAYLADISPKERRAANFGLVGAAFGLGFILGPAIGGLLGEFGPRAPIFVAGAVALANAALAFWALPESLPKARRTPFQLGKINPFTAILRIGRLGPLRPMVLAFFFFAVSTTVYPAVWSYFTIERFGWSSGMVGISLASYGFCAAVVQAVIIRFVLNRLGEWRTAGLSLLLSAFALTTLSQIGATWVIFAFMPVVALGIMAQPALQAIMANTVSDREQGTLQGVLAGVNGVAMIVGPPLMTGVFGRFTGVDAAPYLPGAPFLVAAALSLAALFALGRRAFSAPSAPAPSG